MVDGQVGQGGGGHVWVRGSPENLRVVELLLISTVPIM